jgi:hypothetical protein
VANEYSASNRNYDERELFHQANFTPNSSWSIIVNIATSDGLGLQRGYFNNNDGWNEAGNDNCCNATISFRFTNVGLPAGAVIDSIHLYIVEGRWDSGTTLKIYWIGQLHPSPVLTRRIF